MSLLGGELIWERSVPGSTDSTRPKGFPTGGHGLALRSLGASAPVFKRHFKAYARLGMSHELKCLLKII